MTTQTQKINSFAICDISIQCEATPGETNETRYAIKVLDNDTSNTNAIGSAEVTHPNINTDAELRAAAMKAIGEAMPALVEAAVEAMLQARETAHDRIYDREPRDDLKYGS